MDQTIAMMNQNHVIPALIKKFHIAKVNKENVTIWGSGKPKREFIHVDDMASGIIHILENYKDNSPINLGTGKEYTIEEIAIIIKNIVGFTGEILFDSSKPDGIARKILDNKKKKSLNGSQKLISMMVLNLHIKILKKRLKKKID